MGGEGAKRAQISMGVTCVDVTTNLLRGTTCFFNTAAMNNTVNTR